MRKSIIALLILALLGVGGYWLQRTGQLAVLKPYADKAIALVRPDAGKPAPKEKKPAGGGNRGPAAVEVAAAAEAILSDDLTAIGTLLSAASGEIAPETSGRVVEVKFSDGQMVKQGDVLFRLDTELIEAELADADARLALAEANFKRNERLGKSRNVAISAVDQSVAELALARTARDLAKAQLNKRTITAPFDGTLGFSRISVGAYVTPGMALVPLDQIDRLKVSFSLPEAAISAVKPGQSVRVTADALPGESFTAVVDAIDPLVDVNGRALQLLADLDNSASRLKPGLLLRVTVEGAARRAVTVPEAAIVPRGSASVVFVVEAGKAREMKVRTGKRAAGVVEITEGLKAGQEVVVAGNTRLANGAEVQLVPPPVTN